MQGLFAPFDFGAFWIRMTEWSPTVMRSLEPCTKQARLFRSLETALGESDANARGTVDVVTHDGMCLL